MSCKESESEEKKYAALAAIDKRHFLHPTTSIKQHQQEGPAFIFTEGTGIYLKDIRGRKIIDGLSSLWNVNIGHGREELAQAAAEQMKKLAFSSAFATNSHEPVIQLSEKIAQLAPGDLTMTFFTSGGSEANDTAFKTARFYWKLKGKPDKRKIISRRKSYHGLTMGATSATGLTGFREGFSSLSPDFYYVDSSIASLEEMIAREGTETIAAFIAEPVQGSGGVNLPSENYFKEVRRLCDENDILFIADEVITGFGRTGRNFGIEDFEVIPDIMCIAKGITSGYAPLGGMIISEKIKHTLIDLTDGVFMHGFTYSGHPMCCAVALKNLEIIAEENMIANVRQMGEEMEKGFKYLQTRHKYIGNIRGLGLLRAFAIIKDKTQRRLAEPISPKIAAEAQNRGLLIRSIIYEGQDTLAFAPPFCITKEEVELMISILDDSLAAADKG